MKAQKMYIKLSKFTQMARTWTSFYLHSKRGLFSTPWEEEKKLAKIDEVIYFLQSEGKEDIKFYVIFLKYVSIAGELIIKLRPTTWFSRARKEDCLV